MSEGAARETPIKMPFADALVEVVKSLHKDPVLVYGIGAGIVLVGALAFTASVAPLLVVAAVLIVVLVGRIATRTQAVRAGIDTRARTLGGRYRKTVAAEADVPEDHAGDISARFTGVGTDAEESRFGNVKVRRAGEPEDA